MGSRVLKQVVYGLFFAAVFAGFIFLVYYFFFRSAPGCFNGRQDQKEEGIDCGGVCAVSCLPANLRPLEIVDGVKIFKLPDAKISLLAEIRNPNAGFAAAVFSYEFRLLAGDASSTLIDAVRGGSFIHAGEIKYLNVLNFAPVSPEKIARAELVFGAPDWQAAARFPAPSIDFQKAVTNINSFQISVDGTLVNNDTIPVTEAMVQALFKNAAGQIIGVSETVLNDLIPGDSRAFTVLHPLLPEADAGKTQLRVYAKRQ